MSARTVEGAQTALTEARDVADAYAEQVTRRKGRWEANPTPDSWDEYQAAVHQYRAARDKVRVADADLDLALRDRRYASA